MTQKQKILKVLYDTKMQLTASQIGISNANQHLIDLENQKLIKRVDVQREKGSPFKIGYVDNDTKLKAEDYLKRYNLILLPTPMEIVNTNKPQKKIFSL